MGGTDVNASLSLSSSATSGIKTENRVTYGDIITGGGRKQTPPWVWVALAGAALVAVSLYLIRK